jgi:hypothetical protein
VNSMWHRLLALLAAPALLSAMPLPASPPPLRDLRVVREALDSIESVNGVPLHIERYTGRDVPELLLRWLAEWRMDEGTVGQVGGRSGEWRLYSRLLRSTAQEVLQARGQGDASELLWSRLALSSRPMNTSIARHLPAGCKEGPRVQGRDARGAFDISSAVCRRSLQHMRTQPCGLEAEGTSLCVLHSAAAEGNASSALVFLRRMAPGARR